MERAALKNATLEKMLDLLVPAPDPVHHGVDRSEYERFALPHVFKPRLSFFEACLSVFAAISKIFLGSLLFAVWGTYSLLAWSTIHSPFLRVIVLLPLLLLFLFFFALILMGISAAHRSISHKRA
jgi:hypothetical protein